MCNPLVVHGNSVYRNPYKRPTRKPAVEVKVIKDKDIKKKDEPTDRKHA